LRRRIPQPARSAWPVVLSGERIVWVPGFDLPEDLRLNAPGLGVRLESADLGN